MCAHTAWLSDSTVWDAVANRDHPLFSTFSNRSSLHPFTITPMKKNLPASVLMMLGLTTGCQECGRTHVGPCLSIAPEPNPPDQQPTDTAITPCLEYMPEEPRANPCLSIAPEPEPKEPRVGPCLKYALPPEPKEEDDQTVPDGGAMLTPDRSETRERVLASGVLPEDVVALLQARQKS